MKKALVFLLLLAAFLYATSGGPDDFGHEWFDDLEPDVTFEWIDTVGATDVTADFGGYEDDGAIYIELPFPVTFYGNSYEGGWLNSNGAFHFSEENSDRYYNTVLPDSMETTDPHNFIAVHWDDMKVDPSEIPPTQIFTKVVDEGTSNRMFAITWYNSYHLSLDTLALTYQLVFYEGAGETDFVIQYLSAGNTHGQSATIGIENDYSTDGLTFSFDTDGAIYDSLAVFFTSPTYTHEIAVESINFPDTLPTGTITPTVTIANNGDSDEGEIAVFLEIFDGDVEMVYSEMGTISSIASGTYEDVELPEFTRTTDDYMGNYTYNVSCSFVDVTVEDERPSNDSLSGSFFLLAYDVELVAIVAPAVITADLGAEIFGVYRNNGGENASLHLILEVTDSLDEMVHDVTLDGFIEGGATDTISFGEWIPGDFSGMVDFMMTHDYSLDQRPWNDTLFALIEAYRHTCTGGPDSMGHYWFDNMGCGTPYEWIDTVGATEFTASYGTYTDDGTFGIDLPFTVTFYGEEYDRVWVNTNGGVHFDSLYSDRYNNTILPNTEGTSDPNNFIALYWDDMQINTTADPPTQFFYKTIGVAPMRQFVITYRNSYHLSSSTDPLNYQVIFSEGPYETEIKIQYLTCGIERGSSATVGIENADGTDGLTYCFNDDELFDEFAILFSMSPPVDSVGPAFVVEYPDTLWLVPGSDEIVISPQIIDLSGVVADTMYYSINGEDGVAVADSVDGYTYLYPLAPLAAGDEVSFSFVAYDSEGNRSTYPETGFIVAYEQMGGPDATGFYWMSSFFNSDDDSLNAFIPEYEWIELHPLLGGSGTELRFVTDDWIDGLVAFGMRSFPYYSALYNELRVCSNGWVTWDTDYTNAMFAPAGYYPHADNPPLSVAPLFADLVPGADGKIFFQLDWDNDRVIIEWYQFYISGGDEELLMTFEMVLDFASEYPDIKFQYQEVFPDMLPDDFVIGIQNADGSAGLSATTWQYPDEALLPTPECAIRFFNPSMRAIEDKPSSVPTEFAIESAYPNPFNSMTTFEYSIPSNGDVRFEIYDVEGKLIDSRDMTSLNAGVHSVNFDATGLASGVYMAKIHFDGKVAQQKVLYVR